MLRMLLLNMVQILSHPPNTRVIQSEEITALEAVKCGFESHHEYHLIIRIVGRVGLLHSPAKAAYRKVS